MYVCMCVCVCMYTPIHIYIYIHTYYTMIYYTILYYAIVSGHRMPWGMSVQLQGAAAENGAAAACALGARHAGALWEACFSSCLSSAALILIKGSQPVSTSINEAPRSKAISRIQIIKDHGCMKRVNIDAYQVLPFQGPSAQCALRITSRPFLGRPPAYVGPRLWVQSGHCQNLA